MELAHLEDIHLSFFYYYYIAVNKMITDKTQNILFNS